MNDIGTVIRKTQQVVIHMSCLPETTAEHLQSRLWEKIGLWIPVEQCSVKSDNTGKNWTALVVLDRDNVADALQRWLESTGETIVCKPATDKTDVIDRNRRVRQIELVTKSAKWVSHSGQIG